MTADLILTVFLISASSMILGIFSSVQYSIADRETEIIEQIDAEFGTADFSVELYYAQI